ncbi:MAG: FadR family transcriptional regulator [Micrococcales bacterium]|nr:FadR family transcriptional regulator [Micrococcales bacterium]
MTEERPALEGAVLHPVRTANALEQTVARLLQTVRLGVVAPGGPLPSERELALTLGVGRDTVREAIRELTSAGWLVTRRGRYGGTFAADPPPSPECSRTVLTGVELEEILALREVLECGAVRAAAARALSAPERAGLAAALEASTASAPEDYRRLDSRLHLAIAESAGIPPLVALVAENRVRINAQLDAFPLLPGNVQHSSAQHADIVAAVLAGRPAAAEAAMREHLAGSAELLRGFLA